MQRLFDDVPHRIHQASGRAEANEECRCLLIFGALNGGVNDFGCNWMNDTGHVDTDNNSVRCAQTDGRQDERGDENDSRSQAFSLYRCLRQLFGIPLSIGLRGTQRVFLIGEIKHLFMKT